MDRPCCLGLAALLGGGACQADDLSARAVWLRDTLVLDNQLFLDTVPERAAGKFAKMGADPYLFFRGTAPQYARDASEAGDAGAFGSRVRTADTRDVALIGDPHPENIGTFRTGDGQWVVDFNDFDAARYGPFDFDVRRLALGIDLTAHMAELAGAELEPSARAAAVREVALGYVDEIRRIAADPSAATIVGPDDDVGEILAERFDDAIEETDERKRIDEYTELDGRTRTMFYGDIDPPLQLSYGEFEQVVFEDTVEPVDEASRALAEAAVADYATRRDEPVVVLGVSRRLGGGVSSYPNERFYVLVAGATDSPDDDVLLEVKQVLDPLRLSGFTEFPDPPFENNAARVVQQQRALQAFEDDDPWLGDARVPPWEFRVRERGDTQSGVGVDRIAEEIAAGAWTIEDLADFAYLAGRTLARAHGLAPKRDGQDAALPIARALGADPGAFVDETDAFVRSYAPQIRRDYALFVDLLIRYGPTLGYPR